MRRRKPKPEPTPEEIAAIADGLPPAWAKALRSGLAEGAFGELNRYLHHNRVLDALMRRGLAHRSSILVIRREGRCGEYVSVWADIPEGRWQREYNLSGLGWKVARLLEARAKEQKP